MVIASLDFLARKAVEEPEAIGDAEIGSEFLKTRKIVAVREITESA
jgi:hypothetical protein